MGAAAAGPPSYGCMGLSLTVSRLRKDYKLRVHPPDNEKKKGEEKEGKEGDEKEKKKGNEKEEKGGGEKEGKGGGVWMVEMHQDPQASSPSLAYQVRACESYLYVYIHMYMI